MGLKRQIRQAIERPKNDTVQVGMTASNIERVLAQFVMPDDALQFEGAGTSVQAPGQIPPPRSFFRIAMIEEALTFSGQASQNLTTQLPAGAVVLSAHLNFDAAVVLATGTKVGLGVAATPAQLALSGAVLTKNTKTDNALAGQVYNAAQTIQVASTDNGGAAAGTITSGTVRARVIYRYSPSIPNAV